MLFPKPQPKKTIPTFRFSPSPNRAHEINWLEWSAEAFNRAKTEKKPILLSIAAVWCHWCHIMDETSYSDEKVIKLINEKYIPVRVDADKRPDIQDRYLLGGWPTTAILANTGEIITGGTYMPPSQFKKLLKNTSDYYQEKRESLEKASQLKRDQIIESQSKEKPTYHEIGRATANEVMQSINRSFDSQHGGFNSAPKFPNPPAIELLLRRAFLENETFLLEMATLTLDHMAKGEIFDKVWGGFFRYSTKRDWRAPHYEKILAENAMLIQNYLHAYQISDQINYREIASKTLKYVDALLTDKENGGFYGSQDADEHFYKLDAEERLKAKIPYIDPIIYVDANALMISAYVEAYKVSGERNYLDFALKTVRFLLDNCYSRDKGMAHYYDDRPHFIGWLSDQANMIGALIDIYNVTGDFLYLDFARILVGICEKLFLDKDNTFFDRSPESDEPELGALFIRKKPVNENSMMARQLYRLSYLDNNDRYEKMAEAILSYLNVDTMKASIPAAHYGLAVDEVITLPVIFTVIGKKDKPAMGTLLKAIWRYYLPGKETRILDPVKNFELIEKSGFPVEHHPAVYPCIGRMCLPAVETVHELKSIIEDLPGRPR
ncbi:MAG: DUF255 domain-containing protein [Actinomycetota bacterium]